MHRACLGSSVAAVNIILGNTLIHQSSLCDFKWAINGCLLFAHGSLSSNKMQRIHHSRNQARRQLNKKTRKAGLSCDRRTSKAIREHGGKCDTWGSITEVLASERALKDELSSEERGGQKVHSRLDMSLQNILSSGT